MAKVIFSAGHSPVDKGAVIGDLIEYDLTTKIIDALEPMILEYKKLEPKRIPTGLSLPQKIQWINSSGYKSENNDIAVEVHINDEDGTEDGIECWHAERGDNASKDLCTKVMNAISKETGMRKRSVKSEYDHQFRRLGYVHNTATISALLEVGFMDNPKDKKILTSEEGIKKIAKGFLIGILDYFGLKEGEFDKEPNAEPSFPVHTDPDPSTYSGAMPNLGALPSGFGQTGFPLMAGGAPVSMPSAMPVAMPQASGALPHVPGGSISASVMNLQEKKDMVTRLYQKVLGRNPDQHGLQYYANSQMSEDALMRLMVESKEHKNIVKAARDYVSTKTLLDKREREIIEFKARLADKEQEIQGLTQYFQKVKEAVTETPEMESIESGNGRQNSKYDGESYTAQAKMRNSIRISKDKASEVRRQRLPGSFQPSEAIQFAKGLFKRKK